MESILKIFLLPFLKLNNFWMRRFHSGPVCGRVSTKLWKSLQCAHVISRIHNLSTKLLEFSSESVMLYLYCFFSLIQSSLLIPRTSNSRGFFFWWPSLWIPEVKTPNSRFFSSFTMSILTKNLPKTLHFLKKPFNFGFFCSVSSLFIQHF